MVTRLIWAAGLAMVAGAAALTGAAAQTQTTAAAATPTTGIAVYGVEDWQGLVPVRRVDFQSYRTATLADPTLSADEKARRITARFKGIEDEVRALRTKVYTAYERTIGIGNSATKGSGGGSPKVSNAKCTAADKPDMVVTDDRVRGAYRSGGQPAGPDLFASGTAIAPGSLIAAGGTQICAIRLKQSGKGRKVAYTEGRFRIRADRIAALVEEEVGVIMAEIGRSPL